MHLNSLESQGSSEEKRLLRDDRELCAEILCSNFIDGQVVNTNAARGMDFNEPEKCRKERAFSCPSASNDSNFLVRLGEISTKKPLGQAR